MQVQVLQCPNTITSSQHEEKFHAEPENKFMFQRCSQIGLHFVYVFSHCSAAHARFAPLTRSTSHPCYLHRQGLRSYDTTDT